MVFASERNALRPNYSGSIGSSRDLVPYHTQVLAAESDQVRNIRLGLRYFSPEA